VYPGPMGSVLTPVYNGLENAPDLPQAATLCGACEVACPVMIPLPSLLRTLREQQVEQNLRPRSERFALRVWGALALRPRLYRFVTRFAAQFLKWMGGKRGSIKRLPFDPGWTKGRDFPAAEGITFAERYAEYQRASQWRRP